MSMIVNPFLFGTEGGGTDPDFANVVFLSHFDGTDGQLSAADEAGHAITFEQGSGNTQLDTAQKKFGTASLLLAGTPSNQNISCADSEDWNFGSGDFTIEGFVRFANKDSDSGNQVLVSQYDSGGNQRSFYLRLAGGNTLTAFFSANGTSDGLGGALAASWTPSNDVWYYVVFEREGTNWYIGVDTTTLDTVAGVNLTQFNSTEELRFGCLSVAGARSQFVNGWLDEWRITKGVARYGGVYSVPTSAFPNA